MLNDLTNLLLGPPKLETNRICLHTQTLEQKYMTPRLTLGGLYLLKQVC